MEGSLDKQKFSHFLQADWQSELYRKSDQNEALKQKLNQLQQENSDLQAEVVKLRYSPHVEEVRNNQQVREKQCCLATSVTNKSLA